MTRQGRLVVVSNRVPSLAEPKTEQERRAQAVSGLVSSLRPALQERSGLWFGWSGKSTRRLATTSPSVTSIGPIQLATVDLYQKDAHLFYTVFANQTLWPLLHSFLEKVVIRQDAYRAYRRINRSFAEALYPLLRPGDLVWIHDYHLFHMGSELRHLGWNGKIGFFLHIPFPSVDIFAILPWAQPLLEGLFSYDLVGVQTAQYAHNLTECLRDELGCAVIADTLVYQSSTLRVVAFPIGIDPAIFEPGAQQNGKVQPRPSLERIFPRRRVILAVERMDYTKGIPERLLAFENLLERYPSFRGKVSLAQISVPSRSQVPEYIREKDRVDQLMGRINGRFAESDWLPVHHLFRSYSQPELAGLYRRAEVCLVTPLRDGMNLVAKEFVAAQADPPGVLVLSRFCGAAETMQEALLVNPYDIEGTADAIRRALDMPVRERHSRWEALARGVREQTAYTWCDSFLSCLTSGERSTSR